MDKKKTLAIYYIATGPYKEGFKTFNENIHLFMPNMDKTVVILSDGLREWNDKEENGIKYKVFHIDHYPWPIITLFKMYHIYNHKVDCDYACYLNANLKVNPLFDSNKYETHFNYDKLNVTFHAGYEDNAKKDAYNFIGKYGENPKSISYIGSYEYYYCQGAFFFGCNYIFFEMCRIVSMWTKKDLIKNIIPKWHDETYLNKWVLTNDSECFHNYFITLNHDNTNVPLIVLNNVIRKTDFKNCRIK